MAAMPLTRLCYGTERAFGGKSLASIPQLTIRLGLIRNISGSNKVDHLIAEQRTIDYGDVSCCDR